ncbi:hypothetical protein OROHE_003938 [Orobanche hederae]
MILILCMMSACLISAKLPITAAAIGNKPPDRLALLDLKAKITEDPLQIMKSWNVSTHFCSWVGVTCDPSTKRVLILNLSTRMLAGSIPPSIGNLTHLTKINLEDNSFHGEIPQEMGCLLSLQRLALSYNSFSGKIPKNLSCCTQLRLINLFYNRITGSIPDQLGSLLNLNYVDLSQNNLTGSIPGWIGNFSSLDTLYLGFNNFQGSIPNELGRLTSLRIFQLGVNNLSGTVPSSVYNMSSISNFAVTMNQLRGEIPTNVGITLPNLQEFYVGGNRFTGTIPSSLSNASGLQWLDFSQNGLTGTPPAENLGRMHSLVLLNLNNNRLGSGGRGDLEFLSFLSNCTNLKVLDLGTNNFGGELPDSIANLSSTLKKFIIVENLIHGKIPLGFGNLVNLTHLAMGFNSLAGSIPDDIGKLQKLVRLILNANKFSGPIPSFLGSLTSLRELFMGNNRFEGSIPPSLGNCQSLLLLGLTNNNLSGTIPNKLFGLSALFYLGLSRNSLTGAFPFEVDNLINLVELRVSQNKLSGEIPTTLTSCSMLEQLYLDDNEFVGAIPRSLGSLKSLKVMNISHNNLSGQIPEFLGKFSFHYLDLSQNNFEGELPTDGIFSNASGFSIIGNLRLCGGIPRLLLPSCSSSRKTPSPRRLLAPKVVIPVACALALIIVISCLFAACSKVKKSKGGQPSYNNLIKSGVSYSELVQSTDGFSAHNLIGSGSFGFVYKGVLPSDGTVVAVKVLNLQQQGASKSFIDECKALKSTRHRNLLKIITVCSSIDNQGNDFKSLVYEFMKNGSLDSWLYTRDDDQSVQNRLSFIQRLNIAIDVASALGYLHNHCETSIVHCDLKPSNVLLDEDMVAHVGDFGLARFLLEASDSQTMSTGLKGSIGYVPPEYGMGGHVSILGDAYSYGILLIEMFTEKDPPMICSEMV